MPSLPVAITALMRRAFICRWTVAWCGVVRFMVAVYVFTTDWYFATYVRPPRRAQRFITVIRWLLTAQSQCNCEMSGQANIRET